MNPITLILRTAHVLYSGWVWHEAHTYLAVWAWAGRRHQAGWKAPARILWQFAHFRGRVQGLMVSYELAAMIRETEATGQWPPSDQPHLRVVRLPPTERHPEETP